MPLWKDIYFRCPACRGHLMVDRAGAGFSAPCPHCSASVRVPHRSGLPPRLARGLAIAGANAGLLLLVLGGVWAVRGGGPAATTDAAAGSGRTGGAESRRETGPAAGGRAVPPPVELPSGFVPEERNQELLRAHQALQGQYEELGNWVLQNVRGKYPMPERLVSRLRLSPVDENFGLHGDVAEVLNVQPEEKVLVDDALMATRETLAQMEMAMVTVTQSSPDKATLYIPAFADSGAQAKDDLYAALTAALGEARFNRLLDMTAEELERQYHYFGNAQRTMVFEQAVSPDDPENPFLVIKDGWIRPDGPHGRTYEVSETSVRELPAQYKDYVGLLPAYVAAFAQP